MAKNVGNYLHYIPQAKERPDMPGANEHVLIQSIPELVSIFEEHAEDKYMSLDFETSDLSPEDGFIVGYSFAFSPNKGYYVPVKHATGNCLGDEALKILYKNMVPKTRTFYFHAAFDIRFFEYAGFDLSEVKFFDVQVGIWLADTNVKMPSLKWAEKWFLGWCPDTFEQTLGDAKNFYYLDPKDAYQYACVDAEGTFALVPTAMTYFKESKVSGQLDNEIIYPLMKWENEGIKIDIPYLEKKVDELTPQLRDIEQEIYSEVGYQFALNSGKQLGDALQSVGITTGVYTAKGQMKTDINTLTALSAKLGDTKETRLLTNVVKHSKLSKLVGSFFESLRDEAKRMNGRCRFAYITTNVPTGRLASGSDKKNNFYAHLNVQAISKPHPVMWYVHDGSTISDEELQPGEVRILDWVFSLTRKSDKWEEGFEQEQNVRSAFMPEDDCYWVSIDFNAQELRIPAALANVTPWVRAFQDGTDPHKSTAIAVWGEENYNKDLRKKAKVCFSDKALFYTDLGAVSVSAFLYDHLLDWDGNLQKAAFFMEERDGYEIELSNGQIIEVTQGHKLPVADKKDFELVPIEELSEGRTLVLTGITQYGGYKKFRVARDRLHEEEEVSFDEEIAYMCGCAIGDGHIAYSKSKGELTGVAILAQESNKEYLKTIMGRFGNVKTYHSGKDWVVLTLNSRRIARWMNEHFGRTVEKRIPNFIYQCPRTVMLSFLAGLLDTDGSVDSNHIELLGCNERLMREEAQLVAMLGFASKWNVSRSKCRGKEFLCYRVNILFDESVNEIPLRVDYKIKALLNRKWSNIVFNLLPEEKEKFEYSGKYNDNVYNFLKGNAVALSRRTAMLLNDFRKEGAPATIVRITPKRVNAVCLQCETHKFIASALKSPNCNFSLQYGGTKYTLQEKLGIQDLDECEKILQDWKRGVPQLFAWQDMMIRKAKKKGTVYTYFGRPRRVKFYLNSAEPKIRAFGIRTVKNAAVQGCGADLTKIGMLKLWRKLLNPKLNSGCRFLNTIHDEVNISIPFKDREYFKKCLAIANSCMLIKPPGWSIGMGTGVEIGDRWGRTWAFKVDEDGNCIPKWEDVPTEEEKHEIEVNEPEPEEEENIFSW